MSEPTVIWNAPYPIADAENGKFVSLDMSDVVGYSQLSANQAFRGRRYALLTKSVGTTDVAIQDQITTPFLINFTMSLGTLTLLSAANIDTTMIYVSTHSASAGNAICLKSGNRFYQGEILSTTVSTITLDTPLDYTFPTTSYISYGVEDMNVDGSSVPKIFNISMTNFSSNLKIDVTQISLHITDNAAMDDSKFGGMSKLTKGVVLRKVNGEYKNIFNVKDNGEIIDYCINAQYNDKAGGAGIYGLRAFLLFGGQENIGVVVRLSSESQDELQIIIQDNLTGLAEFHAVAFGHVVDE